MASALRKADLKPEPVVLEPVFPPNLIDEYGDLAKLREAFAPTERRYKKALDALKELVDDARPEAAFTAKGERYTLQITARGIESKPNVGKARKLLSKEAFMKCVTLTKAALEKFLLKPQIEEICDETQSGPRCFKTIPLSED
jgi:hypothetical protein